MVKKKTCIFISGQGSNLKNIINRSRDNNFPIKICLVISDNKKAYGVNYAKKFKIPFKFINANLKKSENDILLHLKNYRISFICLAGYMKIISKKVVNQYKNKIINIHPSLLPKYRGLNTYSRIIKNKERKTGCTVHFVNDKLDEGDIILKKKFFIESKDDELMLKQKTQRLEYNAYPEAIIKIFKNQ